MGVTGLWSLLEGNSQIYKDYHLRDSKLVVDGSNLAYHLYFRNFLDLSHGGECLRQQPFKGETNPLNKSSNKALSFFIKGKAAGFPARQTLEPD
uniref:XPG N-terminal domain-containing protein n=1 Tax=Gadus morhua TaxID=8049 RepID=A0A8C5FT52_GADMO